jgi:hypothetical protein
MARQILDVAPRGHVIPNVIPRRYTTKPTGRSCIKRTQNETLSSGRYWLNWYQTLSIPVSATKFS